MITEIPYDNKILKVDNNLHSIPRYISLKKISVGNLLERMNLNEKYFAILANGKKVEKNYILNPNDVVLILPKIAGGIEKIIE